MAVAAVAAEALTRVRVLLATFDAYSHVTQAIPLVQRLVVRGHEVRWLTHQRFAKQVAGAGAILVPSMVVPSHEGIAPMPLEGWVELMRTEAMFQAADLNLALEDGADVLLVDPMMAGVSAAVPAFPDTLVGMFGCVPLLHILPDADFVLQASLPQCELPIPPQHQSIVACIGPLLPPPVPGQPQAPEIDPTKPLVLVTQGTLANDPARWIDPALDALADLPVQVIATCAERPHPDNARCIPWVSFSTTVPKASVVVSAGGFATMQWCAAAGVPMVVGGETEDKPDVGRRVEWAGLGRHIPDVAQIRDGVLEVLHNPRYREQAWRLAAQCALQDSATLGVQVIELARSRAVSTGEGRDGLAA